MDWSKAKSILIVAFLITNMLLGVFVVSSDKMEDPTISEEFLEEVVKLLGEKEIKLNTNIPTITPSLPPIIVEYESLSSSQMNEYFFKGKGDVILKDQGVTEIVYGDEIINIKNSKIFDYESNSTEVKYEDLDREKVEDIALEFVGDKKFQRENMRLTSISKREDVYIVRFSKFHNNKYVERAYLNIYIDETGVRSVKRLWLDIKGDGEKEIYINTAPKAILSLLTRPDVKGRVIEDISLCYYFDPEEHSYLEAPTNAKRGKTIPAWRVLLDDGNRIIIDNY